MTQSSVVYPRIKTARSIVQTERDIIEHEIEALTAFRDRFRSLETTVTDGGLIATGPGPTTATRGIPPERIAHAYRETVLDMAHYDDQYDEPLLVNVEEEFGTEIRALFESSQPLRQIQCQLIDGAVADSIDRRQRMKAELDREDESLAAVADRLEPIEQEFLELLQHRPSTERFGATLRRLQTDCDALASERQATIHKRPTPRIAGIGARSLVAYLYDGHDHRFPALREIAEVASHIVQEQDG